MRSGLARLRTECRLVARDPMLLLLGSVPLGLVLALRVGFPHADRALPFALTPHADLATGVLLLLTPLMYGFVVGLMLLDERDEGVLLAVSLTPVGKAGFLRFRLVLPVLWSAAMAGLAVWGTGLSPTPPERLLPLALLAGLQAPLFALFLPAFAGNKVEGMALGKVGNLLAAAGAAAALLPVPWRWTGVLIPHFWLLHLFLERARPLPLFLVEFAVALAVHLLALGLLLRLFHRRVG